MVLRRDRARQLEECAAVEVHLYEEDLDLEGHFGGN
jgi:hypothetical protein